MAKKMRKLFAMLLAVCMVMSMLSVSASAEGEEVPEGNVKCGMEVHVHDATCYTLTAEDCTIQKDLNCSEHAAHGEACYETHVHVEGTCYTVIPASEDWTCEETAEDHVHAEGTCYTVIPASENWTCEESTEPQLVCPITELHVQHDEEACYEEHTHVESCYVTKQICELPVHPAHEEDCLTETGKALIDAVIQKMTVAPELQVMWDARETVYADTADYPAAQAAADYATWIEACFAERDAAQAAYEALDAELKPFVSAETLQKLAQTRETLLIPASASVTGGEGAYTFQSVYPPVYEMSNHALALADGSGVQIPGTLLLVEAGRDGNWTMDGPYGVGSCNYEVLYSCAPEVDYEGGVHYRRLNLEDSAGYTEETAAHIRGIVSRAYPYISLEQMKAELEAGGYAYADGLTRADVIAAVQAAIWSCTGDYTYYETGEVTGNVAHDYAGEMFDWWGSEAYVNEAAALRVNTLKEYLLSLGGAAPGENAVVITDVEVVGDPVPVLGFGGLYEVALKVVLNSGGSSDRDNLTLTAVVGGGMDSTMVTMKVLPGQAEYYMLVPAQSGDEITVELSGTQHLPADVYFYEPRPADLDGDGIATAGEVSRTLVGVSMGDASVYAGTSVLFETDEVIYATGELQVRKVNESYQPLTGAEFTLYADMDNDGDMDPLKIYTVNERGYVVNDYGFEGIVDLIPGITYELRESKAPAGYMSISGPARFDVVMDGETAVVRMAQNLPFGLLYADDGSGTDVLTVINMPQSGGGGGGEIPEGPEEDIEDGDVPLGELPDEELEIPEEDVPLAMAPATGDATVAWMAMSALSGAGLFLTRKKRDEE